MRFFVVLIFIINSIVFSISYASTGDQATSLPTANQLSTTIENAPSVNTKPVCPPATAYDAETGNCLTAGDTCRKNCSGTCSYNGGNDWVCQPAPMSAHASQSSQSAQSNQSSSCVNQFMNEIQRCDSLSSSAQSDCDSENSPTLDAAAKSALEIGKATSQSVQAACTNTGKISAASNAALATFRLNCKNSKDTCANSCQLTINKIQQCAQTADAINAAKNSVDFQKLNSDLKSCNALQTKVDQADQAIQNLSQTAASAANCQSQTAAIDIPSSDPNSEYCQAHPNEARCVASCDRTDLPEVTNSKTCQCYRNPSSCNQSGSQKMTGLSSSSGGATSTDSSASDGTGLNLGSGDTNSALNALAEKLRQSRGSTDSSDNIGGKQGAGAPIGGGGGGAGGGAGKTAGAGGASSADPGKVNSGFYGGSGGGSGMSAGGVSGGTGMANNDGSSQKSQNNVDLRKYLPGGELDPKRQTAGVVQAGVDGVHSANSNLWENIKIRFKLLESTFLPN